MTGTPRISRRKFAIGAATAPLVGLPAHAQGTDIQHLYRAWWTGYAKYFAYDAQWKQKTITSGEFEAAVDPILDRCAQIENQIFSTPSNTILDLAIKCNISAFFDWDVFIMEDGLIADAERLAGKIGPEMAVMQ